MYLETVSERFCYGATEVLGRGAFYYPDATVRIVGWLSKVSVIYTREYAVCLRFRESFVSYAQGFEGASRTARFRAAVNAFCAEHPAEPFRPLTAEELAAVSAGEALSEEFVFSDATVYGAQSVPFFTPVRVDAVLSFRTAYGEDAPTNEAAVYTFDQRYVIGRLGFDGRLYTHGANGVCVAETESFDRPEPWPSGVKTGGPLLSTYRGYVCIGTDCYDYDGQYLEAESVHHRCCKELSELYRKLRRVPMPYHPDRPHITVRLPQLRRVTRELIAEVLIPAMQAEHCIDSRKRLGVLRLIACIDRGGIRTDFYEVFQRLMRMNRDRLCGGAPRYVCSKRLAGYLNTLAEERTEQAYGDLLRDEDALREALRALHAASDDHEGRTVEWCM